MNNNRTQRFKLICAAADKIVEETGVSPSEVSGYAVSQSAFGKKPNGDFYALFEEWLKLRRAVPGAPLADMPAEAAIELEQWTDHLKAQVMQRVTGIVREVAGSFEQTTAMRVGALERLNADQSRRNQAVIATLVETEAELGEAQTRIVALADELKQERDQVQFLLGRLAERDTPLKVPGPETTGDSAAPFTRSVANDKPTVADDGAEATSSASDDADDAEVPTDPSAKPAGELDQASVIPADRAKGGQVEMPPVTNDAANQADVGDDGHG